MEAVAVETEPFDAGGEQAEGGEAVLRLGEAGVVAHGLVAHRGPEVRFRDAQLDLARRCPAARQAAQPGARGELGARRTSSAVNERPAWAAGATAGGAGRGRGSS